MLEREYYPRPDFIRKDWISLDGEWDFSFDKDSFDRKIMVPFCYQSKMSGIGETEDHEIVWYRKTFYADLEKMKGRRLLLKFGAVDYEAFVYVNGCLAGIHKGGSTPFEVDITDYVKEDKTVLTVKVRDGKEADKPRGKQSWTGELFGCWYTPTTGIWQSVWLEYAGDTHITRVKITPRLEEQEALCEVFLSDNRKLEAEIEVTVDSVSLGEKVWLGRQTILCENGYGKCVIAFPDWDIRRHYIIWSPKEPNLVDVEVRLKDQQTIDQVSTYFGMRSVEIRKGKVYLNGEELYQRLVLDQGYWPDSLLTPPDGEAIKKDVRLTKEMGFNGARKHQKIDDPRYYYWADRLGLLVWGELPSCYLYNDRTVYHSVNEMMEFIDRDFNHPCMITWVPVNESWGIRNVRTSLQQQNFSNAMIYLIKALDPTRIVSGNDGWEQTEHTDILAIHDYLLQPHNLDKYDDFAAVIEGRAETRAVLAEGQTYQGQPVLVTEYGGIAFDNGEGGWGYYNKVQGEDDFLARLEPVTGFLINSGRFAGYCYTQMTDVMQEVNGLLYQDRTPKVGIEKLKKIFGRE